MASRIASIRNLKQSLLFREGAETEPSEKIPALTAKKTLGGERLLMKKIKYKVDMFTGEREGMKDKMEKKEVEGIALNRWVAIRGPEEKGDGWSVDHVPTGKAIVQGLKNKKLALIAGKSFVDFIPENIQRMGNSEKMFKMLDKAHAKAFYMYIRDITHNRTDLPFEVWKKDTAWA